MTTRITFGTDGWRAEIARDFTFDNVARAAQGIASYFYSLPNASPLILVGYDQRFQSENFAALTAEVLAGNGLKVLLTDKPTPTPVLSYAILHHLAVGAVNITASHNPATDNGMKVRSSSGAALATEGIRQIEAAIPQGTDEVQRKELSKALQEGSIQYFDPAAAYMDHISKLVDLEKIRAANLHLAVDCMWGNGIGWFPRLLGGGRTRVSEVHNVRNPSFPGMARPEPIPPNVDAGLRFALEHQADVLITNDGDADRIGIGTETGQFVNQFQVFALLTYYLLEIRKFSGPIVRSLSSTCMIDKLAKMYGVPVYETGVGFKNIGPKMVEVNAMLGGEESGGYAFGNHVPERDGILAGLYFLDLMISTGKTPTQLSQLLFDKVGEHFYGRKDSPFNGDRKTREKQILAAKPAQFGGLRVTDLITWDGFRFSLEDGGWLLIRFSGTEPVLRVYCETTHADKVEAILHDGLITAGVQV